MDVLVTVTSASDRLNETIESDALLSGAFTGDIFKKGTLRFGSIELQRLLEASSGCGFEWVVDVAPSAADLESADYLEVRPERLLRLEELEASLNEYLIASSEPRLLWERSPIQWPRGVVVGKRAPKPREILALDFAAEYICGEESAAAFASAEREWGIALIAAFSRPQGIAVDTIRQLFTERVAPRVTTDSRLWADEEHGILRWRRMGCLAYESLSQLSPVARTAEPWWSWVSPGWIVSAGVRHRLDERAIQGWRYWPVFETGTTAYQEHLELMETVRGALAAVGAANKMR